MALWFLTWMTLIAHILVIVIFQAVGNIHAANTFLVCRMGELRGEALGAPWQERGMRSLRCGSWDVEPSSPQGVPVGKSSELLTLCKLKCY